jgi:hypothetical protein
MNNFSSDIFLAAAPALSVVALSLAALLLRLLRSRRAMN